MGHAQKPSVDSEMHELNAEADLLEQKTTIVSSGANGEDTRLQAARTTPIRMHKLWSCARPLLSGDPTQQPPPSDIANLPAPAPARVGLGTEIFDKQPPTLTCLRRSHRKRARARVRGERELLEPVKRMSTHLAHRAVVCSLVLVPATHL